MPSSGSKSVNGCGAGLRDVDLSRLGRSILSKVQHSSCRRRGTLTRVIVSDNGKPPDAAQGPGRIRTSQQGSIRGSPKLWAPRRVLKNSRQPEVSNPGLLSQFDHYRLARPSLIAILDTDA